MIKGKKILLGITGSIAAYKSVFLVRELIKAGAEVKVILTPAAADFVTPLTLSTLSKNRVLSNLFEGDSWENHVALGRWADVMLIAPLSCNSLAKMANGICDNLLLSVYLSSVCPVVVAPAMDEDMWKHDSTKMNLEKIGSFGNHIIPVNKGELASGLFGEGRMAEPDEILAYLNQNFFLPKKLKSKKALVSAGPTFEPIDPVRFIGNHSSGKMGIAIAKELHNRGAEVMLVLGPSVLGFSENGIKITRVNTAAEMHKACIKYFTKSDIIVMAAAVADYTPSETAPNKIKKTNNTLDLKLKKTKDILKELGAKKNKNQILVGFALETENERKNAKKKLKEKNADMIVLNSLNDRGAGFGTDTNKITIFNKNGKDISFDLMEKKDVAKNIVDTIIHLYYE